MPGSERRLTILLVDDDPEARDLLGAGLERAGFSVFTARGERDATEYAKAVLPDLILLEFGRQGYDESFALGRRVKGAAGLSAGVPLVVYASGEDETARDGLSVEVAPREYVVLPDDDHELADLLSGLIAEI